jgi:hypothetical protein
MIVRMLGSDLLNWSKLVWQPSRLPQNGGPHLAISRQFVANTRHCNELRLGSKYGHQALSNGTFSHPANWRGG